MHVQARYDTDDVRPRDRFAYWRESVCASYVQLGCETENGPNFKGSIEITRHSVLSLSRVSGLKHRVERRKRDIRSATDAFFLLSLQMAKASSVSQFGKTAVLRPGDMALYSSTAPYTLQLTDDFSQTVVQLPMSKLLERLPNADVLTACRIDGQAGIGKLVRENVLAFAEHVNSPNAMLQALLQDTLIDLIATGLAAHGSHKLELSSPEQQAMMRAKSFIRCNLSDPDLDRHRVAQDVGISVRRLSDIFSKHDESISAFIRRMRLERVAADFKDPRYAQQTISEIAFRYGFSNLQNFSTTFRAHFGESPRNYRARRKPHVRF